MGERRTMTDDTVWFATAGTEPDLFEAALRLGRCDHPEADLAPYRAHLAELAGEAARASRADGAIQRLEALVATLAGRHGYAGDAESYDDLANANLIDVVDRRRGLPVALGILYIGVARAIGWRMEGLAFPHHFLARIEAGGQRAILDPFAGEVIADAAGLRAVLRRLGGSEVKLQPAHTQPASDRAILLRLINNQRTRLLSAGNNEAALAVVERMLWLAPTDPGLVAEAAEIEVTLGRIGGAIRRLERLSAAIVDPVLQRRIADDVQRLKTRLN
jgi:regulator of sirC expression with transglutaminase-like and TPR domain